MSDNIKIRAEILHSDICNKILALCSGNFDMIRSYPLLDTIFKLIASYYKDNIHDINRVRNYLIDELPDLHRTTSATVAADDKKLRKCHSILFSLRITDEDGEMDELLTRKLITDILYDKKLLKCYSILFSLTKRKDDIKIKLPVCKFITDVIKRDQLTDTLTEYVSLDIQSKKYLIIDSLCLLGLILFTVGLYHMPVSRDLKDLQRGI
jgi:hypothetical protein